MKEIFVKDIGGISLVNCLQKEACELGLQDRRECVHCGFDREEDKRRKELPLVKCEDGLKRKFVGVKHE